MINVESILYFIAGESAGHVFIQGGQINNSERLTVLASGGNGGLSFNL